MQDEVRLLDGGQRAEREQPGITRAGAGEPDLPRQEAGAGEAAGITHVHTSRYPSRIRLTQACNQRDVLSKIFTDEK